MPDVKDDDEAFKAFERGIRPRSVLESENDRVAKGYPPDEALLKHGGEIEDEITRRLAHEAEALRSSKRPAVILEFPPTQKPGGA